MVRFFQWAWIPATTVTVGSAVWFAALYSDVNPWPLIGLTSSMVVLLVAVVGLMVTEPNQPSEQASRTR